MTNLVVRCNNMMAANEFFVVRYKDMMLTNENFGCSFHLYKGD